MGGGYSDLNVYFKSVGPDYKGTGYTVTSKQTIFKECSDFQVITHSIKFEGVDPLSYNVILYEGSIDNYKGEYIFGYYYPNNNEVIESVSIYYSVLAPNNALVISLKTKGNQNYHCLPADLKEAGWDRAYNIGIYSFGQSCTKERLNHEYKKISRNRKICFKIGKESKEVSGNRQMLDKNYYRYIYSPDSKDSILSCSHLFSLDTLNQNKQMGANELNPYYLNHLDGRLYDGIIVYYEISNTGEYKYGKEAAIYMEFIESSKRRVQLKRKDKDGCWWSEETYVYSGDTELLDHLKQIKSQSSVEVVTIILDKKEKFGSEDKFVSDVNHRSYNKYTHVFTKQNKPTILFEREEKTILISDDIKTNNVDVYYLKSRTEDTQPFLIVINDNNQKKSAYHFANSYNFKDWKKISDEVKIEDKINKIEQFAGCIPLLGLLRWYTFQILIGKEPSDEEVKKEDAAQRPKLTIPPLKPDGLPINWIIGGSVGGGVFVISSAALYGVYWYNTTIKLLT